MTAADVTVVANFHREGIVAHPALVSAFLAVDAATRDEVARFHHRLDGTLEIDEADIGTARNFGVARVETPWAAFLDGDDLFDRDWLWKGIGYLQKDAERNAVAHAEIRMAFVRCGFSVRPARAMRAFSAHSRSLDRANAGYAILAGADAAVMQRLREELPAASSDRGCGSTRSDRQGGRSWRSSPRPPRRARCAAATRERPGPGVAACRWGARAIPPSPTSVVSSSPGPRAVISPAHSARSRARRIQRGRRWRSCERGGRGGARPLCRRP